MLVEAPMLTQTISGKEYTMYSDASRNGLGCVLMQDGKVVAYASRQLKPHKPYFQSEHYHNKDGGKTGYSMGENEGLF